MGMASWIEKIQFNLESQTYRRKRKKMPLGGKKRADEHVTRYPWKWTIWHPLPPVSVPLASLPCSGISVNCQVCVKNGGNWKLSVTSRTASELILQEPSFKVVSVSFGFLKKNVYPCLLLKKIFNSPFWYSAYDFLVLSQKLDICYVPYCKNSSLDSPIPWQLLWLALFQFSFHFNKYGSCWHMLEGAEPLRWER